MQNIDEETKNRVLKYFENPSREISSSEYDEDIIEIYEIIENYAFENYILPEEGCNCIYYIVRYKQDDCIIGYSYESEEIYFLAQAKEKENVNIIEVMDIVNNRRQPRAELIDLKMKKLELLLAELKIANLNEEFIDIEIEKIYKKGR